MKYICLLFLLCLIAPATTVQGQTLKKAMRIAIKQNDVVIKNETTINSSNIEFSPAYLQNGIVFPSSRFSGGRKDKKINSTYFELFYADLDPNHNAYKPNAFSAALNSTLHEGPVCFSKDGNTIFFTRNNMDKGLQQADKEGVTRLKIYQAKRGKYDWENVEPLPFNKDGYSVVHPTLDQESGRLYFSSNMPGGYGGYDLYFSEEGLHGWTHPKNLGPTINSAKNELFPFFHTASKQLFFASNGFEGFGGLDIFMISSVAFESGPVINLGAPFNSAYDDLGIIINAKGTKGFFTSARPEGLGKDDIYAFESANGIFGKTLPISIPMTMATLDAATKAPLGGTEIRIFEKRGEGYYRNEASLFEAVLLPLSEGGSNLIFKTTRRSLNKLGSADVSSDESGIANYNFLSQQDYVILAASPGYEVLEFPFSTNTFPKDDLLQLFLTPKTCQTFNGFVKSSLTNGPIPNALINITSEPTGKEELITTDDLGRFSSCLNIGESFTITAYKNGFAEKTLRLNPKENQGPEKVEMILQPSGQKIAQGAVLILENIYYDFDKYNIRAGAAQELSSLAQLMRIYPSMEILLTAHTDSRGTEKYNQELSEKRAIAAKNFLTNRGIAENRIRSNGLGETQLRNHCKEGINCTELDHQYNRRTEVIISRLDENVAIRYELNAPEVSRRR